MVYNWDDKEAECYRLYVEEKRSMDEVISHWEQRGFTPSKRAFQTQFKRWDFPSKQNPAHKNPALVARLRELWEQNYSQKDMIETMTNEGFSINDRELVSLRLRLKLLLRESVPRPKRKHSAIGGTEKESADQPRETTEISNVLRAAVDAAEFSIEKENPVKYPTSTTPQRDSHEQGESPKDELEVAPLTTEEALRKQLRQEQLQKESDEKWRARKRRRRTRGWAGLPADAPGEPPRFPSETTIDEAKAYLDLDNTMYREIRERFLEICQDEDVVKKTIVGPEKWAKVVQKLINESPHLSGVFVTEPEVLQGHDALFRPKGQKALSIDVICMDVTKRLRTMDSRMTLAQAKNLLNINPEQTRHVRNAFAAKLKVDHFTNKHEAGEQHWADLKTAWVNESEKLAKALSQGEADPQYQQKLKAVETLARDVMKRERQEKTMLDPSKKKQIHQGPGPGPAPPIQNAPSVVRHAKTREATNESPPASTSHTSHNNLIALAESADLQIDPSLLLAASDAAELPVSPYLTTQHYHQHEQPQPQSSQMYHQSNYPPQSQTYYQQPSSIMPTPTSTPHSMPLPIYFRLHPHSDTPFPMKSMWLSILQHPSVAEIQSLATREHPSTHVLKLEGLVMYRGDQGGREVTVDISDDDELGAYLGHVRGLVGSEGGSGKATFGVLLGVGGGGGYV